MLIFALLLALLRTSLFDIPKGILYSYEGQVKQLEGIATQVKIKESYTAVTVDTGKEKVLVRIYGTLGEISDVYDLVGRHVKVSGKITLPDGRRNPKCFDYRTYLKGKGIYVLCDASRYKIKGEEIARPILHALGKAKGEFYLALAKNSEENSFGMTAGILFGETSFMDDEYYEAFQRNGIAHILAVSGLHVNMAYDIIGRIFKKKKSLAIDLAAAALIISYAALSGFSVSVVRASSMILLRIIAFHLDKPYDSISSISCIASCLLLKNPYLIFDSGMHLSFCAAYSMAMLYPWLKTMGAKFADKYKSDILYKGWSAAAPGVSAFIGTAPLCIFHFMNFSPFGLILNPLAIALAGVILPVGILGFAASLLLPGILSDYVIYICADIISILCKALDALNKLGTAIFKDTSIVAPPLGMLVLFIIFSAFLLSETRFILYRKKAYSSLAMAGTALLILGILIPYTFRITDTILPWDYNVSKATFLDVGQGDCIHIHYGRKDILIDGGGSYYKNIGKDTLKPYLLKHGIRKIDMAIVTHEDMDHSKGIEELNEVFEISKIIRSKDIYGDQGLEENDSCLITSMDIDGCIFLFMGDADMKREEYLIKAYPSLNCDVLKVGHHGSQYSTGEDFLRAVSPSFAVIQVGKNNNYGHPSGRVIELLDDLGIIYGRTDKNGSVSLKRVTDRELVFINAARDKEWHIQKQPQLNILQGP